MYKAFIRPVLFLFPPETVHHMVVGLLRFSMAIPGIEKLIRKSFEVKDPILETEVFGLRFPNRVGLAAGFDKQANIYNQLSAFGFGHIEIGTVNPLPQPGNPRPRLFRLKKDKALINRMGFNNPGVEAFVENLKRNKPNVIIGGNIGKNTLTPNENAIDDYLLCFNRLYDLVDYFVINVSCPNIEGLGKLQDKDELVKIITTLQQSAAKKATRKPVLLKISPDLSNSQLDDTLSVVVATGIDGIIATNTTTTRDGLKTPSSKVTQIGKGGLSGQPLEERSIKTIRYITEKLGDKVPVIAVGGTMTPQDAVEKIKAGAKLVQLYTGFVYEGPSLVKKINREIANYLQGKS